MIEKWPPTDPIVICHGLIGSLSDQAILAPFSEHEIFAPDLLGYGEHKFADVHSLTLVDQAEHILSFMDQHAVKRANLVGHSVGGAVAAILSIRHPERVKSLVSVEGNMTPPDAFWSASLAQKTVGDIQDIMNSYRADVPGWIAGAGISPVTPETIRIATDWLDHQPASTLKAQAHAVVQATSETSGFLDQLKKQLEMGLELHLVAGSHSRDGWHLPSDIESAAKTVSLIPDSGHLMMLQSPEKFAHAVLSALTEAPR